ncbi:hypothetical protein Acr_00g0044180 [Actinidia rufa]|uniref:Uncharacterized protein n=1 Tax=Actinidia rufa TaxID=165716 RepID=A0A7J0DJ98_9ERIC|nr:hypothetical protein Acr_00g0044180 [Actinidia rufa]
MATIDSGYVLDKEIDAKTQFSRATKSTISEVLQPAKPKVGELLKVVDASEGAEVGGEIGGESDSSDGARDEYKVGGGGYLSVTF